MTTSPARPRIAIVGSGLVAAELRSFSATAPFAGYAFSSYATDDVLARGLPEDTAAVILSGTRSADVVSTIPYDGAAILDMSGTYRGSPDWVYGLRELPGAMFRIRGARRVANPGCIATAAILALRPLTTMLMGSGQIYIDAVGGRTMAGSAPNQISRITSLETPHPHIAEIAAALGTTRQVWLYPKVDPSFPRGIRVAIAAPTISAVAAIASWRTAYGMLPDIQISETPIRSIPSDQMANKPGAWLSAIPHPQGGCLLVACIDNLLKGAAETALYNVVDMLRPPIVPHRRFSEYAYS